MKFYTKLLSVILLSFSLMVSFATYAEVSDKTQSFLNSKEFTKALVSIELDIKNEPFDAKTWYFYSRILYQLDQSNAAKQALNNALNIDKNGSFAKGGMSTIKSFAGDITAKINQHNREKPYSFPKITGQDYDNYLNSVFGSSNHSYSNLNPASGTAIQQALRVRSSNNIKNENSNTVIAKKENVSTDPKNIVNTNIKTTDVNETNKDFTKVFSTLLYFGLGIALVIFLGFSFVNYRKNKKEQMVIKDRILVLFNNLNNIINKIEEDIKDCSLVANGSLLLTKMKSLHDISLNTIQKIDLAHFMNIDEKSLIKSINEITKEKEFLDTLYKDSDYDLNNWNKKESDRISKENAQRIIAEKKRAEEEAKQEVIRKERVEALKIEKEKELERQRLIEEERVKSGYYIKLENQKREQRRIEEEERRERQRMEDQRREQRRKDDESRARRQREESQYNRGNSNSGISNIVTGAVIGSVIGEVARRTSNSDNNDDIWGNSRSSKNDSNNDIWGSSGSSRDDNNNSVWGSGDSSSSSDDSNNW